MTSYYFLNNLGVKVSEENLSNIPMPRFELGKHIAVRSMQLCSIVGGAMVGPAAAVYNGKTDRESMCDSIWYHGRRGFKAGCVMGTVLASGYCLKLDYEGIKDRSYRLRFHKTQVFVDRLTIYGTLAGAGMACYLGEELAKGAWFGFTGGCIAAGLINITAGFMA